MDKSVMDKKARRSAFFIFFYFLFLFGMEIKKSCKRLYENVYEGEVVVECLRNIGLLGGKQAVVVNLETLRAKTALGVEGTRGREQLDRILEGVLSK